MSTNEPMTRERLAEIQERVDAATDGPWERCGRGIDGGPSSLTEVVTLDVECMGYCYGGTGLGVQNEADAEFIAHARTDVPALLAEVERLRALTTVDEDMVERAAAVRFKREFLQRNSLASNDYASHRLEQARQRTPTAWHQYTHDVRAELEAALGAGEDQ